MAWIILNEKLDQPDFYTCAGKALLLCQHFEMVCKEILMWFQLSKALSEEQFDFLGEKHRDFVDDLLRLVLGKSIDRFQREMGHFFKQEEIDSIKDAKESRNYICHEFTRDLIEFSLSARPLFSWDFEINHAHIRTLATGDFVVSKWSYEFHEKESAYFISQDEYVGSMHRWVFND